MRKMNAFYDLMYSSNKGGKAPMQTIELYLLFIT